MNNSISSTNPLIRGTSTVARFSRAVDGDTIRIYAPGATKDESVRLLALDTEESYAVSAKPVTPWGKAAKKFAADFFADADEITVEFPGNDPLDVSFTKYRGNYGRLLLYVYHNGVDFQELMIRKGYSPYYTKYGNADFASHHARYIRAEREAQIEHLGIWDQLTVNGSVVRNYALLQTWWHLRASVIEEYRKLRAIDATVYNTRKDYVKLLDMAQKGQVATVFTEVRSVRRLGGTIGLIGIGSEDRPFSLKIDDLDSEEGQRIVRLLNMRYITFSEFMPRRGYCYVTGKLELYRNNPQMIVHSADAITDSLGMRPDVTELIGGPGIDNDAEEGDTVMTPVPDAEVEEKSEGGKDLVIAALLPDPEGTDRRNETVTIRNRGHEAVELKGWYLTDSAGKKELLRGTVEGGADISVTLSGGGVVLRNKGDELFLWNPVGIVVNKVAYSQQDVVAGEVIEVS